MGIPLANQLNIEVAVKGTAAAAGSNVVKAENVFTFRRTTNVNPVNKVNIDTAFQAGILAAMAVALSARYAANSLTIRILDDPQDAGTSFVSAVVGAVAGDSASMKSAVYMQLKTTLRGPSFRGSKHFAPYVEADTTGDVLTGAGLARWQALQGALNVVMVDLDGNTWVQTVYSRTLSLPQLLPIATIVSNDVTSVLLNKNMGTMRRRKISRVL